MNMMEFDTILLPTVITLISLLLLGWQYKLREQRQVAAVRKMKLNRFGTARGSRNLDVFLPASYPVLDRDRYQLIVLNDGRIEQMPMLETGRHLERATDFDRVIEVISITRHDEEWGMQATK